MNLEPIGRVVGNTGGRNILIALKDSFSAIRGEFVRIAHQEGINDKTAWVIGRIVKMQRGSDLYSTEFGSSELLRSFPVLPKASTEKLLAGVDLVGFQDPETKEIRMPRRPLDPGAEVYRVDADTLRFLFSYDRSRSILLGRLIGYEKYEDQIPIYLDGNSLVSGHLAILAMTGAGKSFTVGRICEQIIGQLNGSVLIFDPHGEYGRMFSEGVLHFNTTEYPDQAYMEERQCIIDTFNRLQDNGGGLKVYAPRSNEARAKYGNHFTPLQLCLDNLGMDILMNMLPDLTEPQRRVLHAALKYWMAEDEYPRDPSTLLGLMTSELDMLRSYGSLSEQERKVLNERSASIVAIRLRQLIEDSGLFYFPGRDRMPVNVEEMVGRYPPESDQDKVGRIAIIDFLDMPIFNLQIAATIVLSNLLSRAKSVKHGARTSFVVLEEAHHFAPVTGALCEGIVKRLAAEGRKFGIGLCVVSQRPGKLDPDVVSQCNTFVVLRIKNPDDQSFIKRSIEYISSAELEEIPALSTGEALVFGKAIISPMIVKIGPRVFRHGGESPNIVGVWQEQSVG